MTPQAEVMWLDGLRVEKAAVQDGRRVHHQQPPQADRPHQSAAARSSGSTPPATRFRDGMVDVVRQVWKRETGTDLDTIPQDLGKFERAGDETSIGLALQQIAPYLRTGDSLPASFAVPIVREERKPKLVASYGATKVAEFATDGKGERRRT
jgi:hypothetical protein